MLEKTLESSLDSKKIKKKKEKNLRFGQSWSCFSVPLLEWSCEDLALLLTAQLSDLGHRSRCEVAWKEHGGLWDHLVWVRVLAMFLS